MGICSSGRGADLVVGIAGSGKTTMLRVAAAAFEASGCRVIGTATSGQGGPHPGQRGRRRTVAHPGEPAVAARPQPAGPRRQQRRHPGRKWDDRGLDHGRIRTVADRDDALQQAVDDWAADIGAGYETSLFAWRRANVAALNADRRGPGRPRPRQRPSPAAPGREDRSARRPLAAPARGRNETAMWAKREADAEQPGRPTSPQRSPNSTRTSPATRPRSRGPPPASPGGRPPPMPSSTTRLEKQRSAHNLAGYLAAHRDHIDGVPSAADIRRAATRASATRGLNEGTQA